MQALSRWLLASVFTLVPATAWSANGLRPRTPALFADVACTTTVEIGAVAHFPYSVPYDDTDLTTDELSDSRRMQFFAFRHLAFDYRLPDYINQADLDRAEANGDNSKVYGADDVLASASAWPASSWIAITADDARVPITAAQAAMGVDWDTTGVEPGTWVVAAYTWEPENNLWSFRMGAVRVVDPGDPDAAGPAAFFTSNPDAQPATVGEAYPMAACIDAPAGSTYTAAYGILEGLDEPTWVPFVDGDDVVAQDLTLQVQPPADASGKSIKIRLEVTDPSGKTYVAYSPYPVLVLGGGGDDGGSAADSTGDGASGGDDGKGCRAGAPPGRGSGAWLVLALVACRRRRTALG